MTALQSPAWPVQLRASRPDPVELARSLGWRGPALERIAEAARRFPLRVTEHYLSLVDPADPADPILRQLLPHPDELLAVPGFGPDAVGDGPARQTAALVHKYPGRALLVTTGACAVNCRFCFRRHFPYDEVRDDGPGLARAVQAIADDPSISEVILSGGDPLSLPDAPLLRLAGRVAAIPHVRRLRVHTRMPVLLPDRVTPALVAGLAALPVATWVVTHFNHPRELHPAAVAACTRLRLAGIPVLNQAVLLAGVNDDEDVLVELLEGLVDVGIKPYYLHQLDRVDGVAHFEVKRERGRALLDAVRARITGIAMPTWVADLPGSASKTPLLLLLALLWGCAAPAPEPVRRSLAGHKAEDVQEASLKPGRPPQQPLGPPAAGAAPLPADRVLAADLDGDGVRELLVGSGEVVWGSAGVGTAPAWELRGGGLLQSWLAADLDGDGRDEVALAFGVGRGFADAPLRILLVEQDGPSPTVATLLERRGERNQVTALLPWGGGELYVAAFESRFVVAGGTLALSGAPPQWLPGHSIRMGMARAVGDFDGDGQAEVAVGRLYGEDVDQDGDLRVLDGGAVAVIPTLRGVRALAAADLDGDGRDELLFGDGWHKKYGTHARYRPSVARQGEGWTTELIEERSDQYAVESFAVDGGRVLAGGNAATRVYERREGRWITVGGPEPGALSGSTAVLGPGDYVVGGAAPRRFQGAD